MHGPLIADGAVAFDEDRILSVGPARRLKADHPDASVHDAGDAIVLPGLVNAHTHLELSDCDCGQPPAGGFPQWIISLAGRSRRDPALLPGLIAQAVRVGVDQCLRFGITTVGDISPKCALTRSLLAAGPLRVVSYGEIIAMARLRHQQDALLASALDPTHANDRLKIGITPHAPYTVEPDVYIRCLSAARLGALPLATHLAETPHETPFLADHAGPFRDIWNTLGLWDEHVPRFTGGPIRLAHWLGLLDYPTLLAHVNYCDDEELSLLAAGRASVVYCPRTHAYFGHPPHRWRDMLRRGINVAVGTDSCASSANLNLVDDLRLLHRLAGDFPPHDLWTMATIGAARAIAQHHAIGAIRPGMSPDFTIFPATTGDPLREILEHPVLPIQVWIGGAVARASGP
jgi:cytosine/adenosine deaminase-related metal-dependent hydrolase